jgi:hypothetical protein
MERLLIEVAVLLTVLAIQLAFRVLAGAHRIAIAADQVAVFDEKLLEAAAMLAEDFVLVGDLSASISSIYHSIRSVTSIQTASFMRFAARSAKASWTESPKPDTPIIKSGPTKEKGLDLTNQAYRSFILSIH